MKTLFVAMALLLTTGLCAGGGCTKASDTRPSQDGATGAPQETGGTIGDGKGSGTTGTGGTAGTSGLDAGAGGGVSDGRQDLPVATGGTADASRDVPTSLGTGGQTGTGGSTGKGGSSGIDAGTAQNFCGYECRADASGVTGWYSANTLLCTANCLGHKAICSGVGTRSEGCFADEPSAACTSGSGLGSVIAYTRCGELPGDSPWYLAWQAQGVAGTGPAVVLETYSGTGGVLKRHANTAAFPPEKPPISPTIPFDSVTRLQVSDLFRRLEAVDLAALPHAPSSTGGCSASLYIRSCTTCAPTTLTYGSPESLTPEMESVWSWFDTILGTNDWAKPRTFCMQVGADP
jgi:hypothetical protein